MHHQNDLASPNSNHLLSHMTKAVWEHKTRQLQIPTLFCEHLCYPHPIFYSSSCFQSGLNISKMIIYKRRQEAKQKRRERRAERRAKRQAKREVMFSILFSFQLLSFGVTAASLLAHCIFLSYANHIYVISHHIQKPPFWAFFLFLLPGSSTSTTFSQFTQYMSST